MTPVRPLTPRKILGTILLLVSLTGIVAGAAGLAGKPISFKAGFGQTDNGLRGPGEEGFENSFGLLARAKLLQVLGDPKTSGLPDWPGVFDVVATVYDINGDGRSEILAHSNDTFVYVFGQDGRVLARLETGYPVDWYQERILNAVSVDVMRPGEPPSIVVANGAAFVQVWRFEPSRSSDAEFAFTKAWEDRADACFGNPGMDARPTIADVDGDGIKEIFVNTEEVGLFAFNANGTVRWKQCWAGGNAEPVIADLEGDGRFEAIFASDNGLIAVFDAARGTPRWSFSAAAAEHGIRPGSVAVAPTVAELDGKAPKEIVFTARYAPADDPQLFDDFNMAIFAVHWDASANKPSVLWKRQPEWAHPLSYTHLLIEDVDADGKMDIFGMDWNTIGHKPGNWENLGPAHLFRLDHNGEDVWVLDMDTWWSNKDIFLFDSDDDGTPELFANGAYFGNDGVWRVNVKNGERDGFLSAAPWKLMRGPIVAELRGDGTTQLVVPVAPNEVAERQGAILVYDLNTGGQ